MLQLRLLGDLALLDAEGNVLFQNSKPGLLLAVLACRRGGTASRDYLAELLWTGKSIERRRASLRQAIHQLTSKYEGLPLESDDTDVWLDGDRITVDLWEFDAAIAGHKFEEALHIHRGWFVAGTESKASAEVNQLIEVQNERISVALQVAFSTLIPHQLEDDRAVEAVENAQAFVALNPFTEEAQTLLIEALRRKGDFVEALQTYRAYVALLRNELDDVPGPEIEHLIADVQMSAAQIGTAHTLGDLPAAFRVEDSADPTPASRSWLLPLGLATSIIIGLVSPELAHRYGLTGMKSTGIIFTGTAEVDGVQHIVGLNIERAGLRATQILEGAGEYARSPNGNTIAMSFWGDEGSDVELFQTDGSSSIVLSGSEDERPLDWSPDNRFLLFGSGKVDPSTGEYRIRLGKLDTNTSERTLLAPLPGHLTQSAAWSPRGTRIAVVTGVPQGTQHLVIASAAGAEESRVNLGSGVVRHPAWSPNGEWIAFQQESDGATEIAIVGADGGGRRRIAAGLSHRVSSPSWLTNRYLAYLANGPDQDLLVIQAVGETGVRYLFSTKEVLHSLRATTTPEDIDLKELESLLERAADEIVKGTVAPRLGEVALSLPNEVLHPGEIVRIGVETLDQRGKRMAPLELPQWTVSDPQLATVSSSGVLHVMGAGEFSIVADFGGWAADTMVVKVEDARLAALPSVFAEDWRRGIDPAVWTPFGDPLPVVLQSEGPSGQGAMLSNGDENYTSGVVTNQWFSLGDGLSIEVFASIPFTGRRFEHFELGLVPTTIDEIKSTELWRPMQEPGLGESIGFSAEGGRVRAVHSPWTPPNPDLSEGWHLVTFQIEPPDRGTLLVDGRVYFRWRFTRPVASSDSVHVGLWGTSLNNKILHGPVRVYRGLRHVN